MECRAAGEETLLLGYGLGWTLLGFVLVGMAVAKGVTSIREEWRAFCCRIGKLETVQLETLSRIAASDTALKDLLLSNRHAVLVEPASFMQQTLTTRWDEHELQVQTQIRLLRLDLQDLRAQVQDVLKTQALLRKHMLPLQGEVPQQLRDIWNQGEMLLEYLESEGRVLNMQALGGALTGLEERLQRFRQETRENPVNMVLAEFAQLSRDIRALVGSQIPADLITPRHRGSESSRTAVPATRTVLLV